MNRAAALLLLSLVACGSGSDPLFGGFTPTNGAAVILPSANCNIPFVGATAISGVLVELTSGADACNVLTKARQCGTGAGSTTLLAGAFSGLVGALTVAPADPGTYPWLANPPTGAFKTSTTSAAKVDATCTSTIPGSPARMTGGSIALSSVTASSVRGSMDVRFDNGQGYKADFDVPVCPVSINICSLFDLCPSHTCVQP
jgi:hypothetical protein